MEERFIRVPRTARYHVLGNVKTAKRLWFVLHGYGQLARYFLNKFEGIEKDLIVVAPEGLSRFYLDAAHQRVGATWMTREDREHEIADQIEFLDSLASSVKLNVAPDVKTGVLGFSQGVATACRWAVSGRTGLDRMVLWSGSFPPEIDQHIMRARLSRTHVDVIHGTKDALVPRAIAEQTVTRLSAAQVAHTLHQFEGGHDLEPVLLKRCLNA